MSKARRGLQGGMVIVGHESPHKFDAPSLDYLRTGQGANSYSGGIYNWESPGVGRTYHDEFTRKLEATVGRGWPPAVGPKPPAPKAFTYQFNLNTPRENFVEFQRPIRNQRGWLRDALMDVVQEANDTVYADGVKHFGEWSRPDEIYDLLNEYRPTNAGDLIDGRRIPNRYRDSSAHPNLGEFESALVDRGIPGVRYPDAYSRDLPEISPSRTENFVVYDPSIMEMVKRYPYSLLAPALLAEGAREQQTPVQSPLAGSLLQ